jgi:BlaI family penicillinase repressor
LKKRQIHELSRRERQIMEIIVKLGSATAATVIEKLADAPSYSAVRAMLRVLEDKGHLRHKQDGPRYVYLPTVPRGKAKRTALRHVLQTFFDDSTESAVAALLELDASRLTDEQLDRMSELIDRAKREGR